MVTFPGIDEPVPVLEHGVATGVMEAVEILVPLEVKMDL
jgi:hypothetical protein